MKEGECGREWERKGVGRGVVRNTEQTCKKIGGVLEAVKEEERENKEKKWRKRRREERRKEMR